MDPVSAIGLVASVGSFITFARKVVSIGEEISHSENGLLYDDFTTETVAGSLEELTTRLSETQSKWMEAHGRVTLNAYEARLKEICESCKEIASKLKEEVQKVKLQNRTRLRGLRSIKLALVSVWKEDDMKRMTSRLDKYERELNTTILVGLHMSAQNTDIKLDQILARTPGPLPAAQEVNVRLHAAAAAGDFQKVKEALRSPGVDVNWRDDRGRTPLHVSTTAEITKAVIGADSTRLNIDDDKGRTPLHHAVLKRRLDVVKVLLDSGADKSFKDDFDNTVQHYAQNCHATRWMLIRGTNPNAKDAGHLNHTGLIEAAWLGDHEGAEFFIQQGTDIEAVNSRGETALCRAAKTGSVAVLELLLNHSARVNVETKLGSMTPLHLAVQGNHIEVVKTLLGHGADKNAKKSGGVDALSEACYRGHHEIARVLIIDGSRVESRNHKGRTPLLEASIRDDGEWTRWLLEKREASVAVEDHDGRNPTWHAARNGNARSLKVLLDHRCPIQKVAKNGESPLGCAARNGHYECAKLLLDAGADMDSYQPQEGGGRTPLCEAAIANRVDIVKLLIEYGADVNIGSDRTGYSALSIAADNGRDEVIKILARKNADLNKTGFKNKDKAFSETPLMRAIEKSHESTSMLLINLGADVNAGNSDGKTALMKATYRNATSIVAALLEKGADVDAQATRSRETALMFAAKRGHVEAATLLVEANANVDLKDDLGRTAWNCARQDGHDRKLDAVLGPVSGKQEILRRMQYEEDVDEIMKHMNEMF